MSTDKDIIKGIDAFVSATTGAGVAGRDKFTSYGFQSGVNLDNTTLENLYTDNDLAAIIVERIVHDALRSGYELDWQGATDEQRRDVKDWGEAQYYLTREVRRARIFSRLFGGGAVFMGIEGETDDRAIMGQDVRFLRAVPSSELYGWSWYSDPMWKDFGSVATYHLYVANFQPREEHRREQLHNISPVEMHESRFVPFYGTRTTDRQTWADKGWGKSVLHRVYDVLLKFEASFDSVLHTLSEQSVPVYKVKALLDLLASENGELLAKRFELINAAKGAYRAVILDQEEDLQRVEANLSSASDVVDAAMVRLAGAAGIPVTLLFGRAPSGQNATGKSDLENWNQQVASEQSLTLGPAIAKLYTWLLAQGESPLTGRVPEDLTVNFPAVETPSIQDQVNFYAQIAGADAVYEKMGAATSAEIAIKRNQQKGTLFPSVDLTYLKDLDELRKESLLNPPEPMEMAPPEEPEAEPEQDSVISIRDGLTYIKSGDEEYVVGGNDE